MRALALRLLPSARARACCAIFLAFRVRYACAPRRTPRLGAARISTHNRRRWLARMTSHAGAGGVLIWHGTWRRAGDGDSA